MISKKCVGGCLIVLLLFLLVCFMQDTQIAKHLEHAKNLFLNERKIQHLTMEQCEKKLLLDQKNRSMQNRQIVFQEKHVEDAKNVDIYERKIQDLNMEIKQCERKLLLDRKDLSRKPALQILTLWLAPIVWDGTYDLRILNNQFKNKTIGLFVFAVKK
ncbi:N-acetyllactosaminide alpha-1,3-galactosyltransferase-like isoform X2 [Xenopus tropicalis]|nr:N-acetyllactosaminide alpha-1,3-galactosyltransferase-like isoform X2 [Xenopus tropicalis]